MRAFNLPALGEEQYVLTLNKRELVIILHLLGSVTGDVTKTWRWDTNEMYVQINFELNNSGELDYLLDLIFKASESEVIATDNF